jgi:hypothetical protein
MLSSIRKRSSSFPRYFGRGFEHAPLGQLGVAPIGRAQRFDELFDVAALPAQELKPGRGAVTGMKDRFRGELGGKGVEV